MFRRYAGAVVVLAALTGCASTSETSTDGSGEDNLTGTHKVAGFDFEGFQTLQRSPGEVCPEIVDAVAEKCHAANGVAVAAKSCRTLCSVPIAQNGQVAGFDFDGFHSGPMGGGEFCIEIVDAVAEQCRAAGGEASAMKGCRTLCSVPVAGNGMVAGYDFSGPTSAPAPSDVPVACPEVVVPESETCHDVGGRIIATGSCKVLCSSPIAP